jgi:class 3 adenylate cyclase
MHQLESLGVASNVDSSQFLGSISAPTLVINASSDEVVNPRSGDHLAAAINGARRVLVDSDSHFLILGEQWLEVMTLIGEFATGTTLTEPAERRFATIVFTDIVGSTAAASAVGDAAWRRALDEHDRIAWSTTTSHAGTVVKTTGDGLLVRFDSPHTAINFCGDLRRQLAEVGIRIRAGIHTGEIEVRANKDITGIAVNLAARVEQTAHEGTIYVSSTVRDMLLGGDTIFEDRGEHALKGFDQPWRLYECAV